MWRFILILGLPLIGKCENVYERDIYWRDYTKNIPQDAVHVGFGLYVGISLLEGYIIPGTINPEFGKFEGVLNRKAEKTDEVKIMCSKNPLRFKWEYVNANTPKAELPSLSKRLVKLASNARIYCVGRAFHENEWRIGTVNLQDLKILYIWNNDRSIRKLNEFEMLTYLTPNDIVNNNIQANISSDLKIIKDELLNKNNYFSLSVAAELDPLPEGSKDLVKSAIWRIIYEVKRTKKSDVYLMLSNLTNPSPV